LFSKTPTINAAGPKRILSQKQQPIVIAAIPRTKATIALPLARSGG